MNPPKHYIILFFDTGGNVTAWNGPIHELVDISEEEVWNKNFSFFVCQESSSDIHPSKLLEEATLQGRASCRFWRKLHTGEKIYERAEIAALKRNEKELVGFAMILFAQDMEPIPVLTHGINYLNMIEEIADYAIFLIDLDGKVENWNRGAERIKGYQASEIVGQNFRIFYSKEDRDALIPEKLIAEAITTGRAQIQGWRIRKDGSQFWGSVTLTPLHGEQGQIIGFSKITQDLSTAHSIEVGLRKLVTQLNEKNQELERFAYVASHDLRAPANTILSISSLLKQNYHSSLHEEALVFLQMIEDAAGRMVMLVNSLLEHATIGGKKIIAEIDCAQLLEEIKNDLLSSIKESNAHIITHALPILKGYKTELSQLFQNLVDNAIKYRKVDQAPIIEIAATERADDWLFSVQDNGIGIDPHHSQDIFLIFQRLHNQKAYPGTGIGLANCKKIVHLHGGEIWVNSAPGEGSTFYFTISKNLD